MNAINQRKLSKHSTSTDIVGKVVKMLSLSLALLTTFPSMAAESIRFESGETTPALIELYSSHGCSSCPPAQSWVSQYKNSPDLWQKAIPMVFHVDYWDYIGWKDPFADGNYSARQRDFAKKDLINSVYTPGFVVNGKEWTGWFRGKSIPNQQQAQPSPLSVNAVLTQDSVSIDYKSKTQYDIDPAYVNVAILGFDIQTKITRGENAGKNLTDNFVVLGYKRQAIASENTVLDYPNLKASANQYAVAIWLTEKNKLSPIQTIGGFVPKGWDFQ